jgi:hypothetical protein
LAEMRDNAAGIRFSDALMIAEHFFDKPRVHGAHFVFKTPWPGDPRVNLQKGKAGKAKAYQIRQLVRAIDTLALMQSGKEDE